MNKGVNATRSFFSLRCLLPFFIIIFLGLSISGCTTTDTAQGDVIAEDPVENAQPTQPAPSVLYYDFDDILVPKELNLQKNDSFVFQTPGFYGGVLTFTGAVERNSLIAFFENNMAKDNWQAVGSFKGIRSIMLFKKKNRWCVIKIEERSFDVLAEIWVAPTIMDQVDNSPAGNMTMDNTGAGGGGNPFTDPEGGLLKQQ